MTHPPSSQNQFSAPSVHTTSMPVDRKGDHLHKFCILPPSQNTGLLCCQHREQHEKDINIPSKYFTQRQLFAVLNISSEGLEKLTHLR